MPTASQRLINALKYKPWEGLALVSVKIESTALLKGLLNCGYPLGSPRDTRSVSRQRECIA